VCDVGGVGFGGAQSST